MITEAGFNMAVKRRTVVEFNEMYHLVEHNVFYQFFGQVSDVCIEVKVAF